MTPAICKYCGASIVFVDTADTRIPLNPRPDPRGNIVIVTATNSLGQKLGLQRAVRVDPHDPEDHGDELHWMPHFATCPNRPKRHRAHMRHRRVGRAALLLLLWVVAS